MADDDPWYAMPVLSGPSVRLEPLAVEHADGYLAATGAPKEAAAIFRWQSPAGGTISAPATVEDARRHIEAALAGRAHGVRLPYAQIDPATSRPSGGCATPCTPTCAW